ncbi:hypothetical protein GGR43_004633 [Sphingobium jiangsuense]|uniref:Uncharacterized protein n=1 Tax=Sphingobium jiangsuense TaxID=870476 RepID=A0A7W6FSC1_9SPHN|nr:hypothetical protein [Sphingobium jiangsuense]MBB3928888.1 hypothetical protein [Sphingobium jiangsuense]
MTFRVVVFHRPDFDLTLGQALAAVASAPIFIGFIALFLALGEG